MDSIIHAARCINNGGQKKVRQEDRPCAPPEDIAAANAVVAHHLQLAADLHALVQQTVAASGDAGANGDAGRRRDALVEFLARELVPHALAEEKTMYAAAADQPALETLVTAMQREHVAIIARIDALREATGAGGIAAAAGAVEALFEVHLEKENELILPALLDAPTASLAELLRGMHALLGPDRDPDQDATEAAAEDAERDAQGSGCGCGGCGCGSTQQR